MEESEYFQVEVEGGVARCSLKGPRMNAMGIELVPAMRAGLQSVLENDEVRVIVIRGEGGNFSTGADLSIMGENMDATFLCENMRSMGKILYQLHEGSKPVITEVDGWAVGGGFGLALASDITYATERARFFLSFVRISLVPDFGLSYFLTKRVGLALAKELALTGRVIDAQEAYRMGLVNQVIPHEEISEKVMKVARQIADRSPHALALAKRMLNAGHQVDLATYLEMEAHMQSILVLEPKHQQDVKNFFKNKDTHKLS
jgi:2-(1,2-epoxy-1,2-dihydrophenyl)acetyl-CoA isomerase